MYFWLQGKGGNVRKTARATSQKTFISPISLHEKPQLHGNGGNVRKRTRDPRPRTRCTETGEMYGKLSLYFQSKICRERAVCISRAVDCERHVCRDDDFRAVADRQAVDLGRSRHPPDGIVGKRNVDHVRAVVVHQVCHLTQAPVFVDRERGVLVFFRERCPPSACNRCWPVWQRLATR